MSPEPHSSEGESNLRNGQISRQGYRMGAVLQVRSGSRDCWNLGFGGAGWGGLGRLQV